MIKLTLAEQANILLDRIEKNLKAIVDAVKRRKHEKMIQKQVDEIKRRGY